eukprot:gnl/Trimastix_PCT/449.p1 GENE.gnl/Trimastix_PCT/449~~gnl/Trimastix_PCT/449.p1  ORF type:complete len:965 (+),score=176.70 gnl/Trimastix_PCT/449:2060-4954(+)
MFVRKQDRASRRGHLPRISPARPEGLLSGSNPSTRRIRGSQSSISRSVTPSSATRAKSPPSRMVSLTRVPGVPTQTKVLPSPKPCEPIPKPDWIAAMSKKYDSYERPKLELPAFACIKDPNSNTAQMEGLGVGCRHHLPIDCLGIIFQYLDVTDLARVMGVCRTWYHAAQTESIWEAQLKRRAGPFATLRNYEAQEPPGRAIKWTARSMTAQGKAITVTRANDMQRWTPRAVFYYFMGQYRVDILLALSALFDHNQRSATFRPVLEALQLDRGTLPPLHESNDALYFLIGALAGPRYLRMSALPSHCCAETVAVLLRLAQRARSPHLADSPCVTARDFPRGMARILEMPHFDPTDLPTLAANLIEISDYDLRFLRNFFAAQCLLRSRPPFHVDVFRSVQSACKELPLYANAVLMDGVFEMGLQAHAAGAPIEPHLRWIMSHAQDNPRSVHVMHLFCEACRSEVAGRGDLEYLRKLGNYINHVTYFANNPAHDENRKSLIRCGGAHVLRACLIELAEDSDYDVDLVSTYLGPLTTTGVFSSVRRTPHLDRVASERAPRVLAGSRPEFLPAAYRPSTFAQWLDPLVDIGLESMQRHVKERNGHDLRSAFLIPALKVPSISESYREKVVRIVWPLLCHCKERPNSLVQLLECIDSGFAFGPQYRPQSQVFELLEALLTSCEHVTSGQAHSYLINGAAKLITAMFRHWTNAFMDHPRFPERMSAISEYILSRETSHYSQNDEFISGTLFTEATQRYVQDRIACANAPEHWVRVIAESPLRTVRLEQTLVQPLLAQVKEANQSRYLECMSLLVEKGWPSAKDMEWPLVLSELQAGKFSLLKTKLRSSREIDAFFDAGHHATFAAYNTIIESPSCMRDYCWVLQRLAATSHLPRIGTTAIPFLMRHLDAFPEPVCVTLCFMARHAPHKEAIRNQDGLQDRLGKLMRVGEVVSAFVLWADCFGEEPTVQPS